jgi:hypothetical protein
MWRKLRGECYRGESYVAKVSVAKVIVPKFPSSFPPLFFFKYRFSKVSSVALFEFFCAYYVSRVFTYSLEEKNILETSKKRINRYKTGMKIAGF